MSTTWRYTIYFAFDQRNINVGRTGVDVDAVDLAYAAFDGPKQPLSAGINGRELTSARTGIDYAVAFDNEAGCEFVAHGHVDGPQFTEVGSGGVNGNHLAVHCLGIDTRAVGAHADALTVAMGFVAPKLTA